MENPPLPDPSLYPRTYQVSRGRTALSVAVLWVGAVGFGIAATLESNSLAHRIGYAVGALACVLLLISTVTWGRRIRFTLYSDAIVFRSVRSIQRMERSNIFRVYIAYSNHRGVRARQSINFVSRQPNTRELVVPWMFKFDKAFDAWIAGFPSTMDET